MLHFGRKNEGSSYGQKALQKKGEEKKKKKENNLIQRHLL